MKPSALFIATTLLAATCGEAVAGTPIDEKRAVDARARIDITNVRGAVTVSAWDRPEVAISGTLGSGSKGLAVEGGGAHLSIKVQAPESTGWFNWGSSSRMEDSILDIKVPREAELEIDVVSAEVAVAGIGGRSLEVDSVSGKVRIDGAARDVEVDSISGSVEITGSGERVTVGTVSGEVVARATGGVLKFETVSGNVRVEAGAYRELDASSVSGDISVRGRPLDGSRLDSETMSGDVRIELPADLSGHVEAETFSGRIRSDFGTVNEPEHGPGRSIDAKIGSGDARLRIETFSGDVEIRRTP
ncbi:MAG: DUF4097 family beta strand repeat protein [Xanthomonadales bacterium]|nr:DUF4097 family beta strand repeat protein [Xanthomonadales bacterium]